MNLAAWVLLFCINDYRQPMMSANFVTKNACEQGAQAFIAKINSDNVAGGGSAQPSSEFSYVCVPTGDNK